MPGSPRQAQAKALHPHDEYMYVNIDNVNECKLGNFPEIEAYIMISCYNHSLYTSSHFHQLVVTPYDI